MLAHKASASNAFRSTHSPFRPATAPGPRVSRIQHISSISALPVPKADVIAQSDEDMLVSLEERFKMADIDG